MRAGEGTQWIKAPATRSDNDLKVERDNQIPASLSSEQQLLCNTTYMFFFTKQTPAPQIDLVWWVDECWVLTDAYLYFDFPVLSDNDFLYSSAASQNKTLIQSLIQGTRTAVLQRFFLDNFFFLPSCTCPHGNENSFLTALSSRTENVRYKFYFKRRNAARFFAQTNQFLVFIMMYEWEMGSLH